MRWRVIAVALVSSPAAARDFGQREGQAADVRQRQMEERILVPDPKIKWDARNPTEHGVILIGIGGQVFCYVTLGGA